MIILALLVYGGRTAPVPGPCSAPSAPSDTASECTANLVVQSSSDPESAEDGVGSDTGEPAEVARIIHLVEDDDEDEGPVDLTLVAPVDGGHSPAAVTTSGSDKSENDDDDDESSDPDEDIPVKQLLVRDRTRRAAEESPDGAQGDDDDDDDGRQANVNRHLSYQDVAEGWTDMSVVSALRAGGLLGQEVDWSVIPAEWISRMTRRSAALTPKARGSPILSLTQWRWYWRLLALYAKENDLDFGKVSVVDAHTMSQSVASKKGKWRKPWLAAFRDGQVHVLWQAFGRLINWPKLPPGAALAGDTTKTPPVAPRSTRVNRRPRKVVTAVARTKRVWLDDAGADVTSWQPHLKWFQGVDTDRWRPTLLMREQAVHIHGWSDDKYTETYGHALKYVRFLPRGRTKVDQAVCDEAEEAMVRAQFTHLSVVTASHRLIAEARVKARILRKIRISRKKIRDEIRRRSKAEAETRKAQQRLKIAQRESMVLQRQLDQATRKRKRDSPDMVILPPRKRARIDPQSQSSRPSQGGRQGQRLTAQTVSNATDEGAEEADDELDDTDFPSNGIQVCIMPTYILYSSIR